MDTSDVAMHRIVLLWTESNIRLSANNYVSIDTSDVAMHRIVLLWTMLRTRLTESFAADRANVRLSSGVPSEMRL